MNCDNNEFMFGRDFVLLVLRNIYPIWSPSRDFTHGLQQHTPFTVGMGVALQSILQRDENEYISQIRSKIRNRPLTIELYRELTDENFNFYFNHQKEDRNQHLTFFLLITLRAYYFMLNGNEGNCDTIAADTISRFLFQLRQAGLMNERIWAEYETAMLERADIRT